MSNVEAIREKAIRVEPKITQDIVSIIERSGGKVAGLDCRLKSLSSLKRKIETEKMAGLSEEQIISSIRDVLRYTAILDEQNFVTQYHQIQTYLEYQGYTTIVVKNTWKQSSSYKGVNTFVSTFIEKDDVIFELQYHTVQSFELKNGKLHKLYERFRDPNVSQSEKEQIFLEMQRLSATLSTPKDINLIKGRK